MNKKTEVKEFATIQGVKLFRPGVHNGIPFDDQTLDLMADSSNACLDFVLESAAAGNYAENPEITIEKPIPGLINLNHQEYLADTLREAAKGIKARFYTVLEDGVKWLCADLSNVRNDIAHFLKNKFPQRSIELIPELFNPHTGQKHPLVVRSIGFLDPAMPPAVSGLPDNFVVAFKHIQTFSLTLPPGGTSEEKDPMGLKDEERKDEQVTPQAVSVTEFAEILAKLEAAEKALTVERTAREAAEVQTFCERQMAGGVAPAAFPKGFVAFALTLPANQVMEFAEGMKTSPRDWFLQYVSNMAPKVPQGEMPIEAGKQGAKPLEFADLRQAKIAEFADRAKQLAINPKDDREIFRLAHDMAITKYPEIF